MAKYVICVNSLNTCVMLMCCVLGDASVWRSSFVSWCFGRVWWATAK